jgi:hypothetical protein
MRQNAGRQVAIVGICIMWSLFAAGIAAAACPNDAYREGPSAALAGCRAFELVSPAQKANDVVVNTNRFRISQTEAGGLPMAAVFPSLGGFGDVVGSGISFEYLAQRTLAPGTQGWSTHAITPKQASLPFTRVTAARDPLYVGEADPSLTRMVFRSAVPLTDAPNVARLDNLYRRDDVRTAGPGTYQLMTDAFAPISPFPIATARTLPHPAGFSTDLQHILFESVYALTADAPNGPLTPKLYESDNGVVRLVGVLPDSEGGGAAPRAIAGQNAGSVFGNAAFTPHVLSNDGSKAFFTVGDTNFSTSGALYMRDSHGTLDTADDTTVRIDENETASPPATSQPATYWDAAADGSRVFFTSDDVLTDDAPTGQQLYMYDTTKPASDRNLTYISVDNEPADGGANVVIGVLGASADGKTVYYVQRGQAVAGQPLLDQDLGIYVWHEGVGVRYVGAMLDDVQDPADDMTGPQHLIANQLGSVVSPDGRFLLVSLRQPPWAGGFDHGDCSNENGRPINGKVGCRELYLYDSASAAHPVCVSCSPYGIAPSSPAFFAARSGGGGSQTTTHLNHPLAPDGSRVFFTTRERLVAGDVNGRTDAYEYDAGDGSLHLLSSGRSSDDSYFLDATPDSHDVFIATREQLSPWDSDQLVDVYDARVDGGVPAPVVPQPCSGDACQGPLGGTPDALAAGSSLFNGPAVTSSGHHKKLRCRRGRVRRRIRGHVRCVTRAKARKLDAARRAHKNHGGPLHRTSGRGGAR